MIENYRPLNPWGRAMPKPARAPRPDVLYQVRVRTRRGAYIPVGPRTTKDAAESLLVAINGQLALGREKDWTDPHIVTV